MFLYIFLIFCVTTTDVQKHYYISVMGTMGSGKTTAARLIAKELRFKLLEENFGENAFLPRFYKDMTRWAFHSQTFFLMEKITQMLETRKLITQYPIVQDTPIQQDAFSYAKAQHVLGHIDDAEWRLYQKIYKSFEPYFPTPDLIIYLETSLSAISERITKRGRGYEQAIPQSYLELLDMLNHKWLTENTAMPLLKIETDGLNIVNSKKAQRDLITAVKRKLHLK
jgi:deoxyadenosine/deoxycytidine kinase